MFSNLHKAYFTVFQINEEFQRLTTKPLDPKFMSMLDQYTPKLLGLFQSKGGAVGERLQANLSVLLKVTSFLILNVTLIDMAEFRRKNNVLMSL